MDIDVSTFGKIRGIKSAELELMLSWRNAPQVRINMYTHHEISLPEHIAWWNKLCESQECQYLMYEQNGKSLGIIYFTNIDIKNKTAEWGFYSSPVAPKGTGSKMEFLALEYAFEKLDLHKLNCEVLSFNSPVIKMHQKFGFSVEGIMREQHVFDESFCDVYLLGMLDYEWRKNRREMFQKLVRLNRS